MTKRVKVVIVVLCCAVVLLAGLAIYQSVQFSSPKLSGGNYTDEMKMEYRVYLDGEGADDFERTGDHENSQYFSNIDFYNAKDTETLSILENFKTIQQTSGWSCGISSMEMVLNYFDMRADWNEETLAALRSDHSDTHPGTCMEQIIEAFTKIGGLEIESTLDYADNMEAIDLAFIQQHIKDGIPVIVGWNDWGGHWQIIIGYDDMGTADYTGDDVIIVADPFDTTDHNQDGYGVYGAERFYYNFTFYDFFEMYASMDSVPNEHTRDMCFVAVKPAE